MKHQLKDIRLAVVIPIANEEETIKKFLTRVLSCLDRYDRIFCIFDNMCKDNSLLIAKEFKQKDSRVEVVFAPENRCVVDAYYRGYKAAYDSGARWILEMDGGFSHNPDEIPRFLEYINRDYDFVVGCRYMPGGSHKGSRFRNFVSWSGSLLVKFMLRTTMRDMTSGFEMFSRKAMAYVLDNRPLSKANFFQTEIKYLLQDLNWIEVPINYVSTKSTLPENSIKESLSLLWKMRKGWKK